MTKELVSDGDATHARTLHLPVTRLVALCPPQVLKSILSLRLHDILLRWMDFKVIEHMEVGIQQFFIEDGHWENRTLKYPLLATVKNPEAKSSFSLCHSCPSFCAPVLQFPEGLPRSLREVPSRSAFSEVETPHSVSFDPNASEEEAFSESSGLSPPILSPPRCRLPESRALLLSLFRWTAQSAPTRKSLGPFLCGPAGPRGSHAVAPLVPEVRVRVRAPEEASPTTRACTWTPAG